MGVARAKSIVSTYTKACLGSIAEIFIDFLVSRFMTLALFAVLVN